MIFRGKHYWKILYDQSRLQFWQSFWKISVNITDTFLNLLVHQIIKNDSEENQQKLLKLLATCRYVRMFGKIMEKMDETH